MINPKSDKCEAKENDKLNNPSAGGNGTEQAASSTRSANSKTFSNTFHDYWDRAKVLIDEKHLYIILILFVLVVISLLIIIILSVYLSFKVIPYFPIKCETEECLLASASAIANVNYSYDPCENFWNYACAGWISKHSTPIDKKFFSVEDDIRKSMNLKFFHLMHTTSDESPYTHISKIKSFYSQCLEVRHETYLFGFFFEEIKHKLGNWHLSPQPVGKVWDPKDVLRELQLYYGIDLFFKVEVERDDYFNLAPAIKIAPTLAGLPGLEYYTDPKYSQILKAYSNYIEETLLELKIQLSSARQFASSLIDFERGIYEIWDDSETQLLSVKKKSIEELQDKLPLLQWRPFFQSYFDDKVIKSSTLVALYSPEYFTKLYFLIQHYEADWLNKYYIWHFVKAYSPHLSEKFRNITNELLKHFEGIPGYETYPTIKWEYCLESTIKNFAHGFTSLLMSTENIHDKIKESVKLANNIQQLISKKVDTFFWIQDSVDRDRIKTKILNVKLDFDLVEKLSDPKELDVYYSTVEVSQSVFFENIKRMATFHRRRKLDAFKHQAKFSDLAPQDVKIFYKFIGNSIYQGYGLLNYPIFRSGFPLAMIYGSYGFKVASAFMESIGLFGLHYDSSGILYYSSQDENQVMITPKSYHLLNTTSNCIMNQIFSNNSQADFRYLNASKVKTKILADILGLEMAYETYKYIADINGEEKPLPGLSIHNDQLFFLSFAQSLCQSTQPGYLSNIGLHLKVLPPKQRVDTLLRHSQHFDQAFKCGSHKNLCPVMFKS